MPTQTPVFYNRHNGYGCLSTAHMRSSTVVENPISQWCGGLATVLNGEDYIFYSCLLGLRPNRPHQKKRNGPLL
jgi:hypothetical protein